MPVAQGPKLNLRSVVTVGIVLVVVAFGVALIALVAGQRSGRLVLGDLDFRALDAANMAAAIEEDGPILWPDVASGSRDIWLQHLGADIDDGWSAFEARQPGSPRECNVVWEAASSTFADPCDDTVSFPADGAGLPQIAVFLDGAQLIIDINAIRDRER